MNFKVFERYSKQLKHLYEEEDKIYNELSLAEENNESSSFINNLKNNYNKIVVDKDNYIENIYALAVFDYYNKSKPKVIRIRTNEEVSWNDAFGDSFDKIPKLKRHSLVGLVEEDHGKYLLK